MSIRSAAWSAARVAAASVALGVLAARAAVEAPRSRARRRNGTRPRLVYGPTPIISIKYMSDAMRRRGYEATTFVYGVASINQRADFDRTFDELFGGSPSRPAVLLRALVGPYVALGRMLGRGDVFHFFFDGGFLRETPLRFLELQLLQLAGKRVVVMPYGGDVTVPSRLHSPAWRNAFLADYPELAEREAATIRWIEYFCERADFVVACLVHFEMLPRWDLLTTHYYPIDTEEWQPAPARDEPGPLRVFHSSNHRTLKGTAAVLEACAQLAEEGVDVQLDLAEGMPNAEVRRLLAGCDVVAEQFVLGYAMAAMEGMALAKPVLSNLGDPWYYDRFRESTGLDECPIVNTPIEALKETLRALADDPPRRADLGAAGRRYVLAYHGYEPVGRMWDCVYRAVWHGEELPFDAWNPARAADEPGQVEEAVTTTQ